MDAICAMLLVPAAGDPDFDSVIRMHLAGTRH
jgi:hypothetical protein